jgi:hypothetical protein
MPTQIDIAKAFDTVSWPFLLMLLHYMGLSGQWVNCISVLLSSTSTWILLNGTPGQCICHARDLRQGDPLSPFLFLLMMETLNALFQLIETRGLFTLMHSPSIRYHVSLYAEDMVAFVAPTEWDIESTHTFLEILAVVTSLHMNVIKCQFNPIQYFEDQIVLVHHLFPFKFHANTWAFPCQSTNSRGQSCSP